MKKIILIDGNGLIFRAFYATYMRMSVNHTGVPTNAIYLFSSILIKLLLLVFCLSKFSDLSCESLELLLCLSDLLLHLSDERLRCL